jgi:LysM repeat protein
MKLGLLVGLAFMIVIGVLLSDFVQQRVEPVRADLVGSSANVRKGTAAPGAGNPGVVPVVPPINIEPRGQVATNDSINNQPPPETVISIGPAVTPIGKSPELAANNVLGPIGPGVILGPVTPTPVTPNGMGNNTPNNTPPNGTPTKITPVKTAVPAGPSKTYAAVDGDSLYKITTKMYGKWTPKNADLILKANPAMGPKGEKIVIGMKYTIPPLPSAPGAAPSAPANATPPTPGPTVVTGNTTPPKTAPVAAKVPTTFKTYTVKDGDSLWKIANKQAGGHLTELVDLNKDVLKGSQNLKIGMVLKIPTVQVATAE